MAAKNVNLTRYVFEHGGKIKLDNGTDVLTIVDIVEGGGELSIKAGLRETKRFTLQGVLQTPLEGNQQYTDVSFSVGYTSDVGADALETQFATLGTNGRKKVWTMTVEIYDAPAGTLKKTLTLANFFVESYDIRGGKPFDSMAISGGAVVIGPAIA